MALEAVAEAVTQEVATNLEEAASATRAINTQAVGAFMGGVAFGVVLGFYFGYRFNKAKIKAEAFKQSQMEVEQIREVYRNREAANTVRDVEVNSDEPDVTHVATVRPSGEGVRVRQGEEGYVQYGKVKPSVEEIVEQRGYSTRAEEIVEERPLKPPVPVNPTPVTPPVRFGETLAASRATQRQGDWNYARELRQRNPNHPYIIHMDEFFHPENEYSKTSYTLYAADTTLVGEDGEPLADANTIVGMGNLRFGHGSEDENMVYIRNDKLQLDMEITRDPGSYEAKVQGLDPDDTP
jgi:hypothetical protein